MATETIDHSTLSRLVEAGVVRGAHVVGKNGGWAVLVQYGTHERPLTAQRSGQVRVFKRLETLAAYLKGVGLARFDVDVANFDPDAPKTHARPDRAEALKRTHEAAAYDQWFRDQVQASIDDPRPSVPDKDAQRIFADKKATLRARSGAAN